MRYYLLTIMSNQKRFVSIKELQEAIHVVNNLLDKKGSVILNYYTDTILCIEKHKKQDQLHAHACVQTKNNISYNKISREFSSLYNDQHFKVHFKPFTGKDSKDKVMGYCAKTSEKGYKQRQTKEYLTKLESFCKENAVLSFSKKNEKTCEEFSPIPDYVLFHRQMQKHNLFKIKQDRMEQELYTEHEHVQTMIYNIEYHLKNMSQDDTKRMIVSKLVKQMHSIAKKFTI